MAKATNFICGCGLVFGLGNVLAVLPVRAIGPDTTEVAFLVLAWTGVIGAQAALHAIWCVLAPVPGRIRLVVAVGLAVFWYGALFCGIALAAGVEDEFWVTALAGLLCLPMICLGFQAPLWLVRFWLRWRIVREGRDSVVSRMTTLRIRHILVGTAGIALALGAARLASPEGADTQAAFLLAMFIPALLFMLLSAATSLPLLIATMYPRSLRLPLSIVLGAYLAIVVLCFLSVAVFIRTPEAVVGGLFFAGGVGSLIGGYLSGVIGVLLIARRLGYRLRWGRRKGTAAAEEGAVAETETESEANEKGEESGGGTSQEYPVCGPSDG
jgi:hypothetical protein